MSARELFNRVYQIAISSMDKEQRDEFDATLEGRTYEFQSAKRRAMLDQLKAAY